MIEMLIVYSPIIILCLGLVIICIIEAAKKERK